MMLKNGAEEAYCGSRRKVNLTSARVMRREGEQPRALFRQGVAIAVSKGLERRDDPARALRIYEQNRRARTARTQRAARSNGTIYHLGGVDALLRTLALRVTGKRLIRRYDWLYGWQPT